MLRKQSFYQKKIEYPMKEYHELFVKELKNIYSAEKQIIEALSEMVQKTHALKLRDIFTVHLKETKEHVRRLEEIARLLNEDLSGVENEAIRALLEEEKNKIKELPKQVLDVALINGAQRVEHYEIACYGILKAFARELKLHKVEELLIKSSKEEGRVDQKLTDIAEGTFFHRGVNNHASKRKIA